LIDHFFESLAITMRSNLHVALLYGRDDHHKAEAIFKALGRSLRQAVQIDPGRGEAIPSSKGVL
jgi:imidazoleglycerol-phosphate dehydratase